MSISSTYNRSDSESEHQKERSSHSRQMSSSSYESSKIDGHHFSTYAEGSAAGLFAASFWRPLRQIRWKFREFLAEMIGTACITCIGPAVGCLTSYTGTGTGDWLAVTVGWATAVLIGVYMSPASGSHLNPAVTLTMAIYEGFPWKKVPIYFVAQLLGGYIGALTTFGIYSPVLLAFGGGTYNCNPEGNLDVDGNVIADTSGAFFTWPHPDLTFAHAFGVEIALTAILLIGILCMTSPRGAGKTAQAPILVFLLILSIGTCFGSLTGYAINPARDMGPRLALCSVGYSCEEIFSAKESYFLVPLFAPLIGGPLGGAIFFLTNDTKSKPQRRRTRENLGV